MTSILVDTNLLVYLYDQNDGRKQAQAQRVLDQLELLKIGRLSVQCLAEFINIATRKIKPPLTPAQAVQQAALFSQSWPILPLTPAIVLEAGRGFRDYQLAYYDAQIWATAHLHQIPVVFSEDFSDGLVLEGVRFVNPFGRGFGLEDWIG